MKVLSLCDGMSCGRMALEKLGIEVEKYFASEIKDIAINLTQHNFPGTIQLGDVNKIEYKNGMLFSENGYFETNIDLVIFGSPCQSVSKCMKKEYKKGLEDKQKSGLFFECHRILNEVKPKYFLMENVVMKKEDEEVISSLMGVKPVRINSSLVSAQLRDRLYWTNIPFNIPKDRGIKLKDILIDGYCPFEKSKCLLANDSHGFYNGCEYTPIKRFYRTFNKLFGTMVFPTKDDYLRCKEIVDKILAGRKLKAEYFNDYKGNEFDCIRYLWKEERAKLQTVPIEYIKDLSEKDAANLLGDGWTVDVIVEIFRGLLN